MKDRDAQARSAALDVTKSFLMQAPAGSGKTEVLTQRFLALLNVVDHPEQILALTFTKKAAAEMRYRVLQALYLAKQPAPQAEPALGRWRLAQAALERNNKKNWHLLSSPHRLRLYTIDSLCATLVKQSPLSVPYAGFHICADAQPLYERAVRNTLYAPKPKWEQALGRMLRYFNTDYQYFQSLIETMLAQRHAWEHDAHVIQEGVESARFSHESVLYLFERQLEFLKNTICDRLAQGHAKVEWSPLWTLTCFALKNLGELQDVSADEKVDLQPQQLAVSDWQGFARLMLTKDGQMRARLDKRCGFAATAKTEKAAMQQSMAQWHEQLVHSHQWETVQTCLRLLLQAPNTYADDPQHSLAFDIFQVGLAAVAELETLFIQQKQVDYTGLAQSAQTALGGDASPSEVLLRFDYQVQHLLMDEFQDTTAAQLSLFEQMTAGWQAGDGRSLFFVGDPMQSIYGFRGADVNVFFQVQAQGLGETALEFLQLQRNFRTEPGLVARLQDMFGPLFPPQADGLLQQVTFAKAFAARTTDTVSNSLQGRCFQSRAQEIHWLTNQVQQTLERPGKIAVLVRKKSQVPAMTQAFRQAGIHYTAVDLDPLWAFTAVQDLYHLACVLFEPPNSYHFFAVCRGPFLGFGLGPLEILSNLWQQDPGLASVRQKGCAQLVEYEQRLQAFLQVVYRFQQESALSPLERLRGLWYCLLGPEVVSCAERQAVADFWRVFAESQASVHLPHLYFALLRANTSVIDAHARVEIMTIHKSKGLEYGTVFLPCMDDFSGRGSSPFVESLPFQMDQSTQTLFAVRASSDKAKSAQKSTSTAGFIRAIQKLREQSELHRLVYVAMTRAEQQLMLSATLSPNKKGEQIPTSNSILARLWSYFECVTGEEDPTVDVPLGPYRALSAQSLAPFLQARCFLPPQEQSGLERAQFGDFWPEHLKQHQEATPAQFGELIHLWFSQVELDKISPTRLPSRNWWAWFENAIASFGWRLLEPEVMIQACLALIESIKRDPNCLWLLRPRQQRWRERSWQVRSNESKHGFKTLRPDLVFVSERDEPAGLWIIDFKISAAFLHASTCRGGSTPDTLGAIQKAYAEQLSEYAQLFCHEERPVFLGVYQPTPAGPAFWSWAFTSVY